MKKKSSPI